ncbi:MAG: DJ-1/PfpI family protein [Treponema sp.]|nr:DJ-1/PfpI family protein [Treponema sp.]
MKAAVFFADGFEDIEALSPVDYLRRAGIDVITVGIPTGCNSPVKYQDKRVITSSHNVPIVTDIPFEEYLEQYGNNIPDCVVCPGGGRGAQNLGATEKLLSHLEKVFEQKKLVAAICASPAVVLGKTNILNGKKWTCYPSMQTEARAEYISGYSDKVFITDGNLVTSRGPGASEQFAMELVRILAGQKVCDDVHNGCLLR